ncbi:MAG: DctP family TRAP transporter solute-binding subunit, partial [Magnetococcus sp. DMHC-8]
HNSPTDSALHLGAMRFAEEVARQSHGRVQVTVHPYQELGNDDQMLEMARQGALDILLTPTAKLSVAVPAMQYADLPFYFPSRAALYRMLDGEPGRLLLDKLQTIGLVGVTFWENGFKQFTANRPIRSPDDFKGLKIRTMKSRIIMEQFSAMGAQPVLIDFHATRQSLADRVVDGQENPLVAIAGMKIYEVQPHLTLSHHGYLGYVLTLSAPAMQRLPTHIQELLMDTGRALTPFERAETQRQEERFLEQIRQAGVQIHTLSSAERTRFAEVLAHLPRQFEPVIGPDLLAKTEELLSLERRGQGTLPEILVGLDADLSVAGVQASLGIRRGALQAITEINAAGGVLGRPLALLSRDNHALPSRGVQNFVDMAAWPEVVAIMGGQFSTIAEQQSRAAQRLGVPFLVPWAATAEVVEHGQHPNQVFRLSANDRLAGPFLVDAAVRRSSKIALILENSAWGRGNHAAMTRRLQQLALAPVQVVWFNRSDTDFSRAWQDLRQAGAGVVLLVANGAEGVAIINEMFNQATPLPIVAHWGITGSALFWQGVAHHAARLDLGVLQTFSPFHSPRPQSRQWLTGYRQLFNTHSDHEVIAPNGAVHAYDLVHLLAKAIAQAGTTERAAVRQAMETLTEHEGVVKRYAPPFTPEHHDALDASDYFLARFNQQGVLEPVQP